MTSSNSSCAVVVLTYPSQLAVLRHLPISMRRELRRRVPSIRRIEARMPLTLGDVVFFTDGSTTNHEAVTMSVDGVRWTVSPPTTSSSSEEEEEVILPDGRHVIAPDGDVIRRLAEHFFSRPGTLIHNLTFHDFYPSAALKSAPPIIDRLRIKMGVRRPSSRFGRLLSGEHTFRTIELTILDERRAVFVDTLRDVLRTRLVRIATCRLADGPRRLLRIAAPRLEITEQMADADGEEEEEGEEEEDVDAEETSAIVDRFIDFVQAMRAAASPKRLGVGSFYRIAHKRETIAATVRTGVWLDRWREIGGVKWYRKDLLCAEVSSETEIMIYRQFDHVDAFLIAELVENGSTDYCYHLLFR